MAKVQVKRHSTNVDMTAMCDVAFLLLTFFMLATSFKPEEPIAVVNPSSVSEIVLDDNDVMLITIGPQGQVFFSVDNPNDKRQILTELNKAKGLGLQEQQIASFANGGSIGIPLNQLKSYLSMSPADQRGVKSTGIPVDTVDFTKNELKDWIDAGRNTNGELRIAIKADKQTPYTDVDAVIRTFEEMNVHKFNLVTNLEAVPPGTVLYNELKSNPAPDE